MQKCSIVIGSLWGDEGKGHMTDICSNYPSTLNVRFNGGAQAGHTVVTPRGKRHVFSHFGSGTLAKAKTYLSEDFIVNVYRFVFEREELISNFNIYPIEYVNPNCIVTTPWDMQINQVAEITRGGNRHGSCGFGINETVERSKIEEYRITVLDLLSEENLRQKLIKIKNEYVPKRLKEEYNLTISHLPEGYEERILDEKSIDIFCYFVRKFLSHVQIREDEILNRFENVVFEGAQGLLLDQNRVEFFPHVTTSNTGIKNVMKILKNLNYEGKTEIYYMSRCYMTRHGAGPFPREVFELPYENVKDLTNKPNEFQGSLRYGILDLDLLLKSIKEDLENLSVPAKVNVVFTCMDQADAIKFILDGRFKISSKYDFLFISRNIFCDNIEQFENIYYTSGLTRKDIYKYLITTERIAMLFPNVW